LDQAVEAGFPRLFIVGDLRRHAVEIHLGGQTPGVDELGGCRKHPQIDGNGCHQDGLFHGILLDGFLPRDPGWDL
jgi:hypothetical protein